MASLEGNLEIWTLSRRTAPSTEAYSAYRVFIVRVPLLLFCHRYFEQTLKDLAPSTDSARRRVESCLQNFRHWSECRHLKNPLQWIIFMSLYLSLRLVKWRILLNKTVGNNTISIFTTDVKIHVYLLWNRSLIDYRIIFPSTKQKFSISTIRYINLLKPLEGMRFGPRPETF